MNYSSRVLAIMDSELYQQSCNRLPLGNSSITLAANWENIPETLVINGVIGGFLLSLFIYLTHKAWSKAYIEEDHINQGLLSFLYGSRDPQFWYVTPRYEFLGRDGQHHQHDLFTRNIYMPPKLPLTNPTEFIGLENQRYFFGSINDGAYTFDRDKESPQTTEDHSPSPPPHDMGRTRNTTHKSKAEHRKGFSTLSNPRTETNPASGRTESPEKKKSHSPSMQSFFYPSILAAEQLQASALSRKLNRFFALFFKITDADIIYAKGIDAYEYLLFQRHLILIMLFTNILCLGVILPVNWFSGSISDVADSANGTKMYYATSFQQTTIKNVNSDSSGFWAHIICSPLIVLFSMYSLKAYEESIIDKSERQLSKRTLLIGNIPSEQRDRVKLRQLIINNFPRTSVEAIQFVYDTSILERHLAQLSAISVAKEYCTYYKQKYNRDLMLKPTEVNEDQKCNGNCRLCSFIYVATCKWPRENKLPGTEHYADRERYYRQTIKSACEELIRHPSEYAFLTFRSSRQARRVVESLTRVKERKLVVDKLAANIHIQYANQEQRSKSASGASNSSDVKSNPLVLEDVNEGVDSPLRGWSVRYAPHPDNVEYYDLLNMANISKFTVWLLHFLMIIIFIFVTTPSVLTSIVERWSVLNPDAVRQMTGYQAMLINYLSVLLQVVTTAVLPALILLISKQIPYEDSASKEHSIMWKVYLFLVMMVILMPSIGMSSAQAFLYSNINPKCLFPTDNGGYYINYVLSSTLLSTILELIKPVDIISYSFIMITGRSIADFEGGRQLIEREFSVSQHHTSVMLVFSVVMTYAISCPLIAPAGLLFLLIKHAVDHYHLFYTYYVKKVDKNLQRTVRITLKVALLLMLFQTTVAIYMTTATSYYFLLVQIVFWITMAVFLFNCFYDYTSSAMITGERAKHQRDLCACFYLPRVFEDMLRLNALPPSCVSHQQPFQPPTASRKVASSTGTTQGQSGATDNLNVDRRATVNKNYNYKSHKTLPSSS